MENIKYPELSVIITAYNMECYVEECLESVLCQIPIDGTVKIIFVDDGSTDETVLIAQRVLRHFPDNVATMIQQKNCGLSAARNVALDSVDSNYLTFLDCDDFWFPSYWKEIMPFIAEGKTDLIEYDAALVAEGGTPIGVLNICRHESAYGTLCDKKRLSFADRFKNFAWARVYRATLFEGIRFPVGRRYEDGATIPHIYIKCNLARSIARPLLAYRQRFGSITRETKPSDVLDILASAEEAFSLSLSGNAKGFWALIGIRHFVFACHMTLRMPPNVRRSCAEFLAKSGRSGCRTDQPLKARAKLTFPGFYLKYLELKLKAVANRGLPIGENQRV